MRFKNVGRLLSLRNYRYVEWVDVAWRSEGNFEEAAAYGVCEVLVLVLRVDDNDVRAHHHRTDDFEFGCVGFAAPGFCEHHAVRVLERESVENHQAVVVEVHAVENPLVGGKVGRDEWEKRRNRPRVQRRADAKSVLADGQDGIQSFKLPEKSWFYVNELALHHGFDFVLELAQTR